jgi:hypothetical protein
VVALSASACVTHSLAFRDDHRLEITAPRDRSTAGMPVTVRWAVRGLTTDFDSFVVTVDRPPQPAGAGMASLVKNAQVCRGSVAALSSCLLPEQLGARGIYRTRDPQLTLTLLPTRTHISKSEKDHHQVTVALLDRAGRRIGEASWSVEFTVANG